MPVEVPDELLRRRERSIERLASTTDAFRTCRLTVERYPDVAIFATGSLGRGEIGAHSDLDVFVVDTGELGNLGTVRLLAQLIEAAEAAGFPPFSRDGAFLQIHRLESLVEHLGKPEEDQLNVFTARMLLLLESACLLGPDTRRRCVAYVVDRYWAEHSRRPNFKPAFLVNDIVRYWKTLCVQYEGWRPDPNHASDPDGRIDLLKLKFNRLWLCFSGLAYLLLGDADGGFPREHALDLAARTPVERLVEVAERVPELTPTVQTLLDGYAGWLAAAGREQDAVRDWIADERNYRAILAEANRFGDAMAELVMALGARVGMQRLLLV